MLFAIRCIDKADHLPLRQENRPAHIEYVKTFHDRLYAAGPLLDAQGQMCGSLIILDVADKAEAQQFAANDPYALAGLFAEVTIDHWNRVLP